MELARLPTRSKLIDQLDDIDMTSKAIHHHIDATESSLMDEQRSSAIQQGPQTGFWEWNLETNRIYWSTTLIQMYGLEPQESSPDYDLLFNKMTHPEDREFLKKQIQATLKDNTPLIYNVRIIRADGKIRHVQGNAELIRNTDNTPVRIIGTLSDVTDSKQTEQDLRKAELLLYGFFDVGMIGMAITTLDGGFVRINKKFCHFIGYTQEQLAEKAWTDITHPDDLQLGVSERKQVLSGQLDSYSVEKRFIRQDNQIVHGKISFRALRNADGAVENLLVLVEDISKQKLVQEALRQSEDRLRSYFDAGMIGMAITLPEKGFVQFNDKFCQIVGYPREELATMSWTDFTHPDDLQLHSAERERVFAGEIDGYTLEKRYIRKDGQIVYASVSSWATRRKDGSVENLVVFIQDISKRKQAEEALRQSEDQLRNYFDSDVLGMAITSPGKGFLQFNDKFCKIVGYPREELATMTWTDFTHPGDIEVCTEERNQLLTGKSDSYTLDKRYIRKDGHIVHVNITSSATRKQDGSVNNLIVFIQDISDRKQAEEKLQKNEEILRRYFEAGLLGMSISSPDKGLIQLNDTFCQIMGYSREELETMDWAKITHPDDLQAEIIEHDRILSGEIDGYVIDKRCIHKDGHTIYITVSAKCFRKADGSVDYFVVFVQDVSERKQAEDEVKRNEEILRRFYEAGLVGMGFSSPDKGLFHFNDTFCEIIGYSREELQTINWADLTHPDDLPEDVALFNKLLAGEIDGYTREKRCIRKDGEIIHVSLATKSARKTDGTLDYIVSFLEDISSRKKAEEMMHRYEHIVNASSDFMAIVDNEYTYLTINQRYLDAFMKTRDEAIGHSMIEVIGEENFNQISKQNIDRCLAGESFSMQNWFDQTAHGQRYLRIEYIPYLDGKGRVTGVIISGHDMTEQKKAEETLDRYGQIVNATSDYLSFIDRDYTYLAVNQQFLDIFGLTREQVIGKTFTDILGKDRFERLSKAKLDRCLAGEKFNFQDYLDYPTIGKRYMDINYIPYRQEDDSVSGIVISAHDITELKQITEELERHQDDLQDLVIERTAKLEAAQKELIRSERLATLGQLTATVSHELRNPLGACSIALYTLKRFINTDNALMVDTFERLERNLSRCDHIIDELLDFTRVSNFNLQPIDLDVWLSELLDEQSVPDGLTVLRDLNLGNIQVQIDPDRLRRAVINVYDNAMQAMSSVNDPEQVMTNATITVTTHMTEHRIELVITDQGEGIPDDVLPNIFEPLYSTKTFGVGLGLSTVKQIIEQHGGGIVIDSNIQRGTRVILWLPQTPIAKKENI